MGSDKPAFEAYPIGLVHLDIADVRREEGKLYLWVAIDSTPSPSCTSALIGPTVCAFLEALIEAAPAPAPTGSTPF